LNIVELFFYLADVPAELAGVNGFAGDCPVDVSGARGLCAEFGQAL
jgi:hypothetical protein